MDQVVATGELSFQSLDHPLLESSTIIQDIERVKSVMDTDFNEFEMWRASKVRVDPLLTPALVGHVDNTLTQVLNSSAPSKLVGANAEDIRELQNLALARAKVLATEQKAAPLDMVPPLELANLETPPAAAAPVQPAPQPVPVPSPAPTPKSHKKTKTPSTGPRNYPVTTSTPTPRPLTSTSHSYLQPNSTTPSSPSTGNGCNPLPNPSPPMPITPNYRPQQQIQQPFISPMSISNNPMLQKQPTPSKHVTDAATSISTGFGGSTSWESCADSTDAAAAVAAGFVGDDGVSEYGLDGGRGYWGWSTT
ncbi:hypothetical protein BC829DRAFT_415979 [Chytridium lagenaria]|nr:hypothetical protein BC829DRAFT_415979 [Chytridium lagenaria]